MSKKLLSIGEISKLKGVSIKALRYYDHIGILKPAYVNKETGYRYYIPEQMVMLDLITLSLAFHLPLKNLEGCGEGKLPDASLKQLLLCSQDDACSKMQTGRRILKGTHDLVEQIERLEHMKREREFYTFGFRRRLLLTDLWNPEQGKGRSYLRKVTALHEQARKAGLTILTQQGILFDYSKHCQMVYLAVEGNYDGENQLELPEGDYLCMGLRETYMDSVPEIIEERGVSALYSLCMNTDIYDYCLTRHLHCMEVQTLVKR